MEQHRPERIMRMKEVVAMTGLNRSTVYRLIEKGHFPKPYRMSERTSGWKESEVKAWIDSLPR